MPGPYKGKKRSRSDAFNKLGNKGKRRKVDIDQIQKDITDGVEKVATEYDPDRPGGGLFHCKYCERDFIDQTTLEVHFKTKAHMKQMKLLKTEAYSVEESERAAGQGSYVKPKSIEVN